MTKITYNASSKPLNNPVTHSMTLNRFCYSLLIFAAIGSLLSSNPVVVWFLLINVLTVVIYGADKMAARKGMRRVPEATLLVFGVTGGWPGAIVGQQLFRHKTQKLNFTLGIPLILFVQIIILFFAANAR